MKKLITAWVLGLVGTTMIIASIFMIGDPLWTFRFFATVIHFFSLCFFISAVSE